MEVGAQFYTIRDFCKTPEDLVQSMQRIADIGYKNIQLSGVCDFEPEFMREQLDKTGLKCVLTHNDKKKIMEQTQKLLSDHRIFGCKNIGLGWHGFDEEKGQTVEQFVAELSEAAKKIHAAGAYFMYHNHDHEFKKVNGKIILQQLAEAFPAEELGFVLDTFWVQAGGGDPAYWLERLSGRVPCIHLKDYAYGRKMAVIGEGNINFDRVFEKAEPAGVQYMLVEQDDCYGEDPFECLRRSYNNLHSLGFN